MIMTDFEKFKLKLIDYIYIRAAITLWLVIIVASNLLGRVPQAYTFLWWLEMAVFMLMPFERYIAVRISKGRRCSQCGEFVRPQLLLLMKEFRCPACGNKHFEYKTLGDQFRNKDK